MAAGGFVLGLTGSTALARDEARCLDGRKYSEGEKGIRREMAGEKRSVTS